MPNNRQQLTKADLQIASKGVIEKLFYRANQKGYGVMGRALLTAGLSVQNVAIHFKKNRRG